LLCAKEATAAPAFDQEGPERIPAADPAPQVIQHACHFGGAYEVPDIDVTRLALPAALDSWMTMKRFEAPSPIELPREGGSLVFHGVDQGGPSFEARVFLNNPAATDATPTTAEHGYVGSFFVYGEGRESPAPTERVLAVPPGVVPPGKSTVTVLALPVGDWAADHPVIESVDVMTVDPPRGSRAHS
jgi:hypothetical protein